jgi:hypothetical protein
MIAYVPAVRTEAAPTLPREESAGMVTQVSLLFKDLLRHL